MKRASLRSTLAALALGGALTVPASLGSGLPQLDPVPACATPRCGAAVVARVDDELAARMDRLEDAERWRLARTIVAEARAARIDPLLVLAVIEVESAFDPEALSFRGAIGLMQLREPTMREELRRWGISYDDPNDPVANVKAGVRYLRRLLDAFGREEVALMAYNAGPNRIRGYLRSGGIPERFHGYPRRVKAELRRFRRTVGGIDTPLLAEARLPTVAQ